MLHNCWKWVNHWTLWKWVNHWTMFGRRLSFQALLVESIQLAWKLCVAAVMRVRITTCIEKGERLAFRELPSISNLATHFYLIMITFTSTKRSGFYLHAMMILQPQSLEFLMSLKFIAGLRRTITAIKRLAIILCHWRRQELK